MSRASGPQPGGGLQQHQQNNPGGPHHGPQLTAQQHHGGQHGNVGGQQGGVTSFGLQTLGHHPYSNAPCNGKHAQDHQPVGSYRFYDQEFNSIADVKDFLGKKEWESLSYRLKGKQAARDRIADYLRSGATHGSPDGTARPLALLQQLLNPPPATTTTPGNNNPPTQTTTPGNNNPPAPTPAPGNNPPTAPPNAGLRPDKTRQERGAIVRAGWSSDYLLAMMGSPTFGVNKVWNHVDNSDVSTSKTQSASSLSDTIVPPDLYENVGLLYDARGVRVHKAMNRDGQTSEYTATQWQDLRKQSIYGSRDWKDFLDRERGVHGKGVRKGMGDYSKFSEVLVSLNRAPGGDDAPPSSRDVGRSAMLGLVCKLRTKEAKPSSTPVDVNLDVAKPYLLQTHDDLMKNGGPDLPAFAYDPETESLWELDIDAQTWQQVY